MIEIGGRPILWHIMKIYSHHGITDFIICLGYRGYVIKEYFANYFTHNSDLTIDLTTDARTYHQSAVEPWKVTLVDTGEAAMTGGRLKRVAHHLAPGEAFCFTYGDGVADIDITASIAFHHRHGRLATMTTVTPPGRYGAVNLDGERVSEFIEKPPGDKALINGGFFVLSPAVLPYIPADDTPWEREPLERLAREGELMAWRHGGFWQAMDTLRDKTHLETLWQGGAAPWKCWA
jgi:glucose-1-phosphate cytidylyltransferase